MPVLKVSAEALLGQACLHGHKQHRLSELDNSPLKTEELELYCSEFWRIRLISCGVNPIFHHQNSISDHQIGKLLVI
eukprot:159284-Pelagomonas_calceolata.AAC.1